MIFEHYGSKHFDKKMFEEPIYDADDEYLNKPSKGFWGSPTDSKNSWKNFCVSEGFNLSKLNDHFEFKLKRFARVLKVLNKKDLDSLYRKYGIEGKYGRRALDWNRIIKKYDAMILIIPDDFDLVFDLHLTSWDVDSVVVFNPNVVVEIKDKAR